MQCKQKRVDIEFPLTDTWGAERSEHARVIYNATVRESALLYYLTRLEEIVALIALQVTCFDRGLFSSYHMQRNFLMWNTTVTSFLSSYTLISMIKSVYCEGVIIQSISYLHYKTTISWTGFKLIIKNSLIWPSKQIMYMKCNEIFLLLHLLHCCLQN